MYQFLGYWFLAWLRQMMQKKINELVKNEKKKNKKIIKVFFHTFLIAFKSKAKTSLARS